MRVIAALALAAAALGACMPAGKNDSDSEQPRDSWDDCQSFLCEVFHERDHKDNPGGRDE